ncbi:NAD dependent epimerase/dehydratase [Apiospora kogelbergensis]|uniref:NAD dependent epimerase/dehydratase n=1 Tax=Apiospora kogelbergensis TaxID=1337665 RepID=UPI00312E1E0A
MDSQHQTAIPDGSLVLITGITSYVASYTAKCLLERGHRVRVFPSFSHNGAFDLVEIPDLTAPEAFNNAILDSQPSAIIHIAMPMSFDADPNKVITPTVQTMSNLLRAAARVPSVKRFVYTSSIGAAYSPRTGIPATLTKDSWNDAAVEAAWAPPPYTPERGGKVYAAAKVAAERAMFQFVEETKPGFSVTSVAPFFILGPVLHKRHLEGSAGWIRKVFAGEARVSGVMPFGCQINVQDVAALHVAAVLDPDVRGDRLIAAAEPFHINVVLDILRRQYPDRQFMDDLPSQGLCLATVSDEECLLRLLKKWAGRDGWIPLEQGIREALAFDT